MEDVEGGGEELLPVPPPTLLSISWWPLILIVPFPHRFEYLFNFDNTFEIHDDIEVLKRMGMACGLESGNCSAEDLKVARSLVPKALEPYVTGQLCPITDHDVTCYIPSMWLNISPFGVAPAGHVVVRFCERHLWFS